MLNLSTASLAPEHNGQDLGEQWGAVICWSQVISGGPQLFQHVHGKQTQHTQGS